MGLCRKCNIVKNTQLLNNEQICEDCLNKEDIHENVIKEKNQNNENKNIITSLSIGLAFLIFLIIIAYFITGKSRENKIPHDIDIVEKSIKNISKMDIFQNYQAYETLSNFYKDNDEYKKQYKKYQKLNKLSTDCFMKGTALNREYTLNKNSYSVNSFGDNKTTMIDDNTISKRIEFYAKNDFGMEINYISEYECKIDGSIKQLFLYRK